MGPDGTTTCAPTTADMFTCELDGTGTHTILVSDQAGSRSGAYGFDRQQLDDGLGCQRLWPEARALQESIVAAGEIDCFSLESFYYPVPRLAIMRARASSGTLSPVVEVLRPDGTVICGPVPGDRWLGCGVGDVGASHRMILVYDTTGTGTGNYDLDVN
ncbi:MAG: hypothetical protein ACRDPC_21930 [Solirubrobacteraceae bacterium]